MCKTDDSISSGQRAAIFRLAALAVAVGAVPGAVARQAGEAGWIAPLLATPALWAVGWLFGCLTGRGERSFADVCRDRLGRKASALLYIIYIAWALAVAGARLRLSAQRLLWAGLDGSERWLLPVLTLAAVWLMWGKTAVFGRAAVLLCRGVEACLLLVLILTLSQVRRVNLLPIWVEDALPSARAGVTVLGVLCCGFYTMFLPGDGVQGDKGHGVGMWRCVRLGVLLSGVIAVVLGAQGAELAGQLADPFLTLSRHAGLEGAFQRIESLVCAAWLPADLVLLALLFCAGRELLRKVCPRMDRRRTLFLPAIATVAVSGLAFRDVDLARSFCERWLPAGTLVLFVLVPALLLLVGKGAHLVSKSGKNEKI